MRPNILWTPDNLAFLGALRAKIPTRTARGVCACIGRGEAQKLHGSRDGGMQRERDGVEHATYRGTSPIRKNQPSRNPIGTP